MKEKITPLQKALNLWAVILIVWSFYRSLLVMPEWFDEIIAKPIVFILPVYYFITRIEKKDYLAEIGIVFKMKKIISDIAYSFFAAFLFLTAAFVALYLTNNNFLDKLNLFQEKSLAMVFVLALFAGITEESLSRGFVLKKLYEESRNGFSAVFLSSVLFFIIHIPVLFSNARINGSVLLGLMLTNFILGVINGLVFLQRKSLIPSIVIHVVYGLTVSLFFL